MGSGGESTRRNWEALRALALEHLKEHHRRHPSDSVEAALRKRGLPSTPLMRELAREAGMRHGDAMTRGQERLAFQAFLRGERDCARIAKETGLSAEAVEKLMFELGVPFGEGEFGQFAWPGAAGGPGPKAAGQEKRRASEKGQISYNGCRIGLGLGHAGRICVVEETPTGLLIHSPGLPDVRVGRGAKPSR